MGILIWCFKFITSENKNKKQMYFKDNIECNSIGKEINKSINRKSIEKKSMKTKAGSLKS